MNTTTRIFGLWAFTVTGPRDALFEMGAPTVAVKGFGGDDLYDRANLYTKACEAVATLVGRDYDEFPDAWCPLEFSERKLTANKFRNRDGTQQWFVGVYRVGRAYGGPEEGGWWYDTGELVQQTAVCSHAEATALRDELRASEYPETAQRYRVLPNDDDDFLVAVDIAPLAEHFPAVAPRYE